MLFLLLAAAPPALPVCQSNRTLPIDATRPARARPLNQEPDARRILGVLRSENGCSRPVVVSDEIGSRPRR